MTDDMLARQNCCRLCLAPDSECVPILPSLAADKELLSSKIQACVSVKVCPADSLSLRICHSCISFLNSWQSFKNRCLAAQVKQMNWLEMTKNTMRRQMQQSQPQQSFRLTSSLDKSPNQNCTQLKPASGRPMPVPFTIKDEPVDEEADAQEEAALRMNLDPREFLDNDIVPKEEEIEEDDLLLESSRKMNGDPQILTSLGLTQIRKINPYSKMSSNAETKNQNETELASELSATQCRYCHLNFSSATNARRHERNLHRAVDVSAVEIPKFCIKPTTPRSLLKPLPALRPSLLSSMRTAPPPPPVTPEMMGVYDYEKPEKYRHLLTDSKQTFLRKNEDFLRQYQTWTCTCCPQTFPSYKTFMAHMRRKYPTLARNLCFKCLKQFQSKTAFVAHLKKRNCINLYKLYKANGDIFKTGPPPLSPEKVGTKELLNNKVYECKLCSKTFRLKLDFRSHVYEAHGESIRKDVSPGRCGFCSVDLEDPILRRRHYNNMECIVMIHCGTCQEKFEFHQQFIDHVYEMHLVNAAPSNNNDVSTEASDATQSEAPSSANIACADSFNSRLPHSCNICGQTYNNYYNVLRHMEGKHPDQVPKRYMCDKCDMGFPRQGPLRDHMYEVHGTTLPRARREMLSCRLCSEQIDTREKWIQHQTDKHSRYTCCYCTFQTKSLDKFKDHIETHPQLAIRNAPVPIGSAAVNGENEEDDEEEYDEPAAKRMKVDGSMYQCPMCQASFNGNVALSNHMRTHYNGEGVKMSTYLETPKGGNATPTVVSGEIGEGIRRIRCHLCSKRFTSKKTYRKHMLNEHRVRNVSFVKCTICKAEFTHERGLKVHLYKTHGKILTNEVINATYECEICDAEFKSEKSLNQHKGMVHKNRDKEQSTETVSQPAQSGATYWHQCSYCPSNFDTNKKLAIHLNSHTEFDAHDYSCKDCGNVYNGRKSLWVHRYKKHREIPDPSACHICNKVFFTSKMLTLHVKNHPQPKVSGEKMKNAAKIAVDEESKPDADEDEVSEDDQDQDKDNIDEQDEDVDQDNLDLLGGKVHCSVCNEEFSDQDLFDKHMEMHQIDLYTDNPLAAMFDTGPDDPNQYFMNRMSENGAFTCDICPKSFPALTALKVHRNWHFRQDSKQISTVIDSNMRSLVQKKKAANVCEFCDTGFSSASNLRRHVIEVHNREALNDPARTKKFVDKYLECTKCAVKFEGKTKWVKHKISHAKESLISAFEWGCEICGKIVPRKERLIQHMNSHLKSKRDQEDGSGSVVSEDQSNSQDTVLSGGSQGRRSMDGKPRTGEDDEADDDEAADIASEDESESKSDDAASDEESEIKSDHADDNNRVQYDEDSSQQYQEVDPDQDDIQDEDDGDDPDNMGAYSCDLCQVYFETAKQLRRHVTSHFLNGPGSVTLTEIPKEKSSFTSKFNVADDVSTMTPV